MHSYYLQFIFIISLFFLSCKSDKKAIHIAKPTTGIIAKNAMIVSARKEVSEVGIAILKKGGNAFDAMIGTQMALAVCYPFAGSLGSGGFMVYRRDNGEVGSLDFREKAPLLSEKDMYLDKQKEVIPNKSTLGALASGVPGTVAGIFEVHKKFGSLSMKDILAPVINLAKKGYPVTEKQFKKLDKYRSLFLEVNKDTILYAQPYKIGDTIKNIPLANTLQKLVNQGRDVFYKGEIGQTLTQHIQSNGGIISMQDLDKYEAIWRKPLVFDYKGLKLYTMGPPSSGGICLAQILKMIEPKEIQLLGYHSPSYIQTLVEAERRAYADRSYYLGDPDFVDIPIDSLISTKYLSKQMQSFSLDKASPSHTIKPGTIVGHESEETTHYSIVDHLGNAVAVTTTLNGAYGSKVYIEDLGFFLNNEMDDFSIKPGVANMFGLTGGQANAIVPEKRMLSSMTPTIVEKNGNLWMVVGTPGGSTIITSVLQTILNVYEFDMNMQEAVNAPRFHHQWLPDTIMFEPKAFDQHTLNILKGKHYAVEERESRVIGKVDAILMLKNGLIEGAADKRGDDTAIGL